MTLSKKSLTIILCFLFHAPKIFVADPADAKPSSKTVFNLLQVTDFIEKGFIPVTWKKEPDGKESIAFICNTKDGCDSDIPYMRQTVTNSHYVRFMIEGITSCTFGNPIFILNDLPCYCRFIEKQLGKEDTFSLKNVVKIVEHKDFLNQKVFILILKPELLRMNNEARNPLN